LVVAGGKADGPDEQAHLAFCSVKTCSMWARTADFLAFALAVRAGIGRRAGFSRWTWPFQHPLAQQIIVLPLPIASVGPNRARGVAGVEQIGQAGTGMGCGVGDQPAADQPAAAIGTDVVL
jgi:hypothetical protein